MSEFVAFDPNAEVIGMAINAVVAAMGDEVLPVLEKHSLANVDPNAWYPQQKFLDFFADIAQQKTLNTMFDLINIGMKIPENILLPPEMQSIPAIMQAMDMTYQMNHRNGDVGHWHCNIIDERTIEMTAEKPYPDDFDYGAMYSFARRLAPPDGNVKIVRDESKPIRKNGGRSTTYLITW